MNITNKIIRSVFALSLFWLLGCGPTYRPFTEDLHRSYTWDEKDLQKVQFYLSNDIVLTRSLSKGESVIEGGKVRLEEGRRIEEVIFKEGTPGVLIFMPKEDRMAISFDRGNDKYLMFGPSPKQNGRYVLLASSWDSRKGEVTYDGKKYKTASRSALAGLLIDLKKVQRVTVSRKKAPGRTI